MIAYDGSCYDCYLEAQWCICRGGLIRRGTHSGCIWMVFVASPFDVWLALGCIWRVCWCEIYMSWMVSVSVFDESWVCFGWYLDNMWMVSGWCCILLGWSRYEITSQQHQNTMLMSSYWQLHKVHTPIFCHLDAVQTPPNCNPNTIQMPTNTPSKWNPTFHPNAFQITSKYNSNEIQQHQHTIQIQSGTIQGTSNYISQHLINNFK